MNHEVSLPKNILALELNHSESVISIVFYFRSWYLSRNFTKYSLVNELILLEKQVFF